MDLNTLSELPLDAEIIINRNGEQFKVPFEVLIKQIFDHSYFKIALSSKAPSEHYHHIDEVNQLIEVLRRKIDGHDLEEMPVKDHSHQLTAILELEDKLNSKASVSHKHQISDIFNTEVMLAYVREAMKPVLSLSLYTTTDTQAALRLRVVTTHGYAMDTTRFRYYYRRYDPAGGYDWVDTGIQAFNKNTLDYSYSIAGLNENIEYEVLVVLEDTHNPQLQVSATLRFKTKILT